MYTDKKTIVACDLSSKGVGGPFISTSRIINSRLKQKYEFRIINYDASLGRFISLRRIKDLVSQLKIIKPDIVHFSGLQLSGFHIAVACKLAGVKNSILVIRGSSGDAMDIGFFKKSILVYALEPLTLFLVKRFYGVSDFVSNRKSLNSFRKKNYGTIYNLPPKFTITTTGGIRRELGIKPSEIVCVTVARITKDKGYHILTDALLRIKDCDFRFLVVGEGNYLNEMRKKLEVLEKSRKVIFLGHRSDAIEIMSEGDIFVLPTMHETLSNALIEASLCNLALIASRTGGVPEIVVDNYNGILVQPGVVTELSNAISRLVNDGELRNKFSQNAYSRVAEKFNTDDILKKIDELYQTTLKL